MTMARPCVLLRWPRVTAVMTTAAIHMLLLLLATTLVSQHHELQWRQLAIDAPAIQVFLVTQAAAAPAVAPVHHTVSSTPEHVAKSPQVTHVKPVTRQPTPKPLPDKTAPVHVTDNAPAMQARQQPASDVHATQAPSVTPAQTSTQQSVAEQASPALNRKAQPDYAYNPPPDYPMLLRQNNISGALMMRVFVNVNGLPGEIHIQQSSGYRLMDEAALKAVRQWRFVPALDNGQRSASWVEFPINFSLQG